MKRVYLIRSEIMSGRRTLHPSSKNRERMF
jgi:hypothetical protein